MKPHRSIVFTLLFAMAFALTIFANTTSHAKAPASARSINSVNKVKPALTKELSDKGLKWGAPIFIRIFKEIDALQPFAVDGELEVWVQDGQRFKLFKTFPICYFSGELGPKLTRGDNQSPEGFYFVTPGRLNPWSQFHLSFNLGYPNAYDRANGRTGNYLMVHGNCVSVGCYAMRDDWMEQIYALAEAALNNGQSFFRVHIFPFKMTDEKLEQKKGSEWYPFWRNLKEGYDLFEKNKRPPNVTVSENRYIFSL